MPKVCLFVYLSRPQVNLVLTNSPYNNFMLAPKVETPNNFCPSRFSEVCSDLHFLQSANLARHTHTYILLQIYTLEKIGTGMCV